jgi:hypothetical protein
MKASIFDPPPAPAAKLSPLDPPTQLQLFDKDISLPWSKAFLRVGEVAQFLDVSEDQVFRLIEAGELETISISANVATAERQHPRVSGRSLHAMVNRRRKLS